MLELELDNEAIEPGELGKYGRQRDSSLTKSSAHPGTVVPERKMPLTGGIATLLMLF